MTAEILCVGTELLLGDIVNTNAAYIARELAGIGVGVYFQSVVGDNAARLKNSLQLAFSRADIVVMTGGLGPTYDDLTKETVAEYFHVPMEMDEESLNRIRMFFDQIGYVMTANNEKQALMPKGAVVFPNRHGTAPGLALTDGKNTAILLPGPPQEMEPMLNESVLPYLLRFSDQILVSKNIRIFGIGESRVEDLLHNLMERSENPTIAPYAKMGEVTLRVTAAAKTKEEGAAMINPMIQEIRSLLGNYIYGIDVPNLQYALVQQLKEMGMKIAVAESCTGGLLAERLTQVPGASEVFDCGVCAYANRMKSMLLCVKEETLLKYGAVSEQTAIQMAQGVRKLTGADIGVSTTGIAGPDGGTLEKPVGTVFVGIDSEKGTKVLPLHLMMRTNGNERKNIRHMTAQNAFFAALEIIK